MEEINALKRKRRPADKARPDRGRRRHRPRRSPHQPGRQPEVRINELEARVQARTGIAAHHSVRPPGPVTEPMHIERNTELHGQNDGFSIIRATARWQSDRRQPGVKRLATGRRKEPGRSKGGVIIPTTSAPSRAEQRDPSGTGSAEMHGRLDVLGAVHRLARQQGFMLAAGSDHGQPRG
jgi:hypothetical protein